MCLGDDGYTGAARAGAPTSTPVRPGMPIPGHEAGHEALIPADDQRPESAALLYIPITVHHDVIAEERIAQLTGTAFWHLRVKLMAFYGGFLLDASELG